MQHGGKQIIVRQATPQIAAAVGQGQPQVVAHPAVQVQAQQPAHQQVVVAATSQQAATVALQQQQQQTAKPVMQTIQLQGGQRLALIQAPGVFSMCTVFILIYISKAKIIFGNI